MDALSGMGTKYLPTEKDRKLNQRFQQRQNPLPKFSKTAATAKKTKKKK
jgi:hypothetical protein